MDLFVVDDFVEDLDLREAAVLGESMFCMMLVLCVLDMLLYLSKIVYRICIMWLSFAI